VSGQRHHFQNARLKDVLYWKDRGELFPHCCRKAWQWRMYEERVEIGYPVATAHYTRDELVEAGVVGLYGYRRKSVMDAAPRVNDPTGTLIAMLRDAGHDDLADEVIRRERQRAVDLSGLDSAAPERDHDSERWRGQSQDRST
jgi:hypothetical protein